MERYRQAFDHVQSLGEERKLSGDWTDPNMIAVKELFEKGYLQGIDISADGGIGFMDLRLTMEGEALLEKLNIEKPSRLRSAFRVVRMAWRWILSVVLVLGGILTFLTTNLANIKTWLN